VIRDVLADPSVARLAPIQAAADPRKELLDEIHIEVHPSGQGYIKPTRELIRVVIESTTASDAVIVRDALMVAYLAHQKSGNFIRGAPAPPERAPHPIFDRPWKFRVATTLGLLSSVIPLIVPINRSKRFGRLTVAVLTLGLILGAALWWFITHPEFSIRVGNGRLF
jgi:hypothetical protein